MGVKRPRNILSGPGRPLSRGLAPSLGLESVREIATSQPMLKTVVGLSEVGNYLRHLGSFLHRYAWASTSRSPSIGPFEASSLIFQELYLRTVSKLGFAGQGGRQATS